MSEQSERGMRFYIDDPQVLMPYEFVRDPTIPNSLKVLYAVCYSYAKPRGTRHVVDEVTQLMLARHQGVLRQTVNKWMRQLEELGWITTVRLGQGKANAAYLHSRKVRR